MLPHFLVCNGGTTVYSFPSGHLQDEADAVQNADYAAFLASGSYDRSAVKDIASGVAIDVLGQAPGQPPPPDPTTGSTRTAMQEMPRFVFEQRADSSTKLRYTILIRTADTRADAKRLLEALETAFDVSGVDVHMDQSWVQLGDAHENRASGSGADDMCLTDMLPANAGQKNETNRHEVSPHLPFTDHCGSPRQTQNAIAIKFNTNACEPHRFCILTGKGAATTWVREHLGFPEERTMVAGDGANDLPMFFGAGRERGVIVGNAEEVIRENTTQNDPPFIDFS
jgi:hypothetical protein